ncbi:helix-turn-helix domain-containing protein [Patescibacteria group bacterium]|nr:helix-turn-helix domain-containing protein [Patescibacteria group bacterium]
MFFIISNTPKITNLFQQATRGYELIMTTLEDVVEDIVYGKYLPDQCVTCIEEMDGTKLSPTLMRKLVPRSKVIVYSAEYRASQFITYWEQGVIYLAGEVTPTELANLFSTPISIEIKEKQSVKGIDITDNCVNIHGVTTVLTVTEIRIFRGLLAAQGRYLNRQQLLDVIGLRGEYHDRLIDSHVKRLRKKLKKSGLSPHMIVTGSGFGYRIDLDKIDVANTTTNTEI